MLKKKRLKENSFDGAPGGFGGTTNYSTGWGTHSSPGNTQYPDRFNIKGKNTADQQTGGPNGGVNIGIQDPAQDKLQQDIGVIFSKKDTPTPDEVASALQYELGQMNNKDKMRAKEVVLNNLKKDPHHYSNLHMLNIDDKKMDVTETTRPRSFTEISRNVNKGKVGQIFQEMSNKRETKYEVKPELVSVMQDMLRKKEERSYWKRGLTSEAPSE